jgi:hypothetical protein
MSKYLSILILITKIILTTYRQADGNGYKYYHFTLWASVLSR